MKILVCISHVPDTTSKIAFTENNTKFDSTNVQYVIGPYEDFALARAVELKESIGAEVIVINVGPKETEPTLRKALAIGADSAVRIDAEPIDGVFVAKEIATYAKDKGFDIIMTGRESIDYNSSIVHGLLAEHLGWPNITPTQTIDIDGNHAIIQREIEGGHEKFKVKMPFVAGCQEPIAEWKIPNVKGIMMARKKPLEVITPSEATATLEVKEYALPPSKGQVKLIDADTPEELISILKNEAKVL